MWMETMKRYEAHWGTLLVVVSSLLTALFLGLAFVEFKHGGTSFWVGLWLLALVVGCALFAIRGYTVTPDAILVHRLLWSTRLPRAGLQSARVESLPIWLVIRIGNGGFFSCTGWRYSPRLGFYRVFVTDRRHAVVLRYTNRTVVVSPTAPDEFVHDLAVPSRVA
jgi:hypothetical protein